jgi:hypothetical protein
MVPWLIPLIVAAVGAGTSVAVTAMNNRAQKKAAEANTGAVPGPYQPSSVDIGGTQVTGARTQLLTIEEQQQAEAMLAEIDAKVQESIAYFSQTPQWINGSWATRPPSTADIQMMAESIAAGYPEQDQDVLNRWDVAETLKAEGKTVGENGVIYSVDEARTADLFAEHQFDEAEYAKARGQQAAGVATATGVQEARTADTAGAGFLAAAGERMGAVTTDVTGRTTPALDQAGLDAYRAQDDQNRATTFGLLGQAQAGEVGARQGVTYAQGLAGESRGRGLEAATAYGATIGEQEAAFRDAAMGIGPSVAELERQRALEQQTRNNLAMAASSRDPNAYRQALNANASQGGQAAYDAALLRAQEIEAARGQWLAASGQRADLQGYFGDQYGQDVGLQGTYTGLQGTYAGLQPGLAGQLGANSAARASTEFNSAQANQDALLRAEEQRDTYTLGQQGAADQYAQQGYATANERAEAERRLAYEKALEETRMADAYTLGANQLGWSALSDQANVDVQLQGIAAGSLNNAATNASGLANSNADRTSAAQAQANAAYASIPGQALATYATLAPTKETPMSAPAAGTTKNDFFRSKSNAG